MLPISFSLTDSTLKDLHLYFHVPSVSEHVGHDDEDVADVVDDGVVTFNEPLH